MSGSRAFSDLCIFAGPSLHNGLPSDIAIYPPAQLGSVWQAVERGHQRIALVDGVFGARPAVWHKEILYALSRGCTVIGGASMGALRAAELWPMGMVGVGAIYRLYRSGYLVSDAEVALSHGDAYLDYPELSIPLIDLRLTLRTLRRSGTISLEHEAHTMEVVTAIHFAQRTWEEIERHLERTALPRDLMEQLRHGRVFAKARDAALVLRTLQERTVTSPTPLWQFPRTTFWRHQFEIDRQSIPALPPPAYH